MKRAISATLAIVIIGGFGLYVNTRQPSSDLHPNVSQSENAADSITAPSESEPELVSKIAFAIDEILPQTLAGPAANSSVVVQFVFDENRDVAQSPGEHTHIIKEWKGQFSPSIQDLASRLGTENVSRLFKVRLPSGDELDIEISKNKQYSPTRGVFSGRVLGSEYSEAIFSYVNQAVSGSITLPQTGETIAIKNAGERFQYLAQVDASKLGSCGVCAENLKTGEL